MKPHEVSNTLLNFLDLPANKLITKFISHNTIKNPSSIYKDKWSTNRNSSYMAFEWRKHLSNDDIVKVQDSCAGPMEMLGYNPMKNISVDKLDDRYPLLAKATKDIG